MPYVETSIEIKAPRHQIYELAKDMEHYSDFMPDVEYVKIIKRDGTCGVSCGAADLRDAEFEAGG